MTDLNIDGYLTFASKIGEFLERAAERGALTAAPTAGSTYVWIIVLTLLVALLTVAFSLIPSKNSVFRIR